YGRYRLRNGGGNAGKVPRSPPSRHLYLSGRRGVQRQSVPCALLSERENRQFPMNRRKGFRPRKKHVILSFVKYGGKKMNLPAAFEEKMKSLLGTEEYEDYLRCFDEPRYYGLRVNTAKISVEEFLKISPWPLEPVPWIRNGFYYDGESCHPARHPYYFAGLYY